MRTLRMPSAEERDREELSRFDAGAFAALLRERGLLFPASVLEDVEVALTRPGLVLLEGPPGSGKSRLADAVTELLTSGYRQPGAATVAVEPTWRDGAPLFGTWDPEDRRYEAPPALELWMRALRHKAKPHFLVLEGFDLAPPERYLSAYLAASHPGGTVRLHADHLRCQPRAGLGDDLVNFFVCHQDCERCFFVRDGYPQGVTDAVRDFVPARVQVPPNLWVLGVCSGPAAALDPRIRSLAALVRVPHAPLEDLLDGLRLEGLDRVREEALALEARLRERELALGARTWREIDALLREGTSLHAAVRVRAGALLGDEDL